MLAPDRAENGREALKVYIIEGWFGDQEWIEAIYADQTKAEDRCNQLWADRRSSILPSDHWIQDLCKFAVVEHEVVE